MGRNDLNNRYWRRDAFKANSTTPAKGITDEDFELAKKIEDTIQWQLETTVAHSAA